MLHEHVVTRISSYHIANELNCCRDHWAKTRSLNKAVKLYLGAAATPGVDGHLSSQASITVARHVWW
jgi:hypothetical protein